jgi:hypothetical protein
MTLLHEKVDNSFTRFKAWKEQKSGDYNDERLREGISQIFQSQYIKPSNAPDEQWRRGFTHKKVLRDVSTFTRAHPTNGRPLIKPEDMNIWTSSDNKAHSFAMLHNFNTDYATFI